MKTDWFSRAGPWLAWAWLAFIVLAMGAGLAFQVLADSPFSGVPFIIHFSEAVGLTGFAVVGALIVSRHPRHPIGWIWLLIAFSFGIDHLAWGYGAYVVGSNPAPELGAQADTTWIYWNGRGTAGILALTLLLLLFPTGKPLSPAWRIVAWIALGRVILDIILPILEFDSFGLRPFLTGLAGLRLPDPADFALPKAAIGLVGLLCILAATASLVIRLLKTRGAERQQIKWFVYAASFMFPALLAIFITITLRPYLLPLLGETGSLVPGPLLGVITTFGMAVASAIAIFRYRLWDIDIIIRQTLIYGLLSASLALVYFSSIVLFQGVLQRVSGAGSTLVIVASTLVIAALFSPLRRRIQDFIDRRFYRRKYNSEQIMAAFSAGLREDVDLEEMSQRLVAIVAETMQPESLSLWLNKPGFSQTPPVPEESG